MNENTETLEPFEPYEEGFQHFLKTHKGTEDTPETRRVFGAGITVGLDYGRDIIQSAQGKPLDKETRFTLALAILAAAAFAGVSKETLVVLADEIVKKLAGDAKTKDD